jgi:hypothetical protein
MTADKSKARRKGGMRAPGIEPDTALKKGMQLHQRPETVAERLIHVKEN